MTTTQEMICITCPMGCTLQVTRDGDTVLSVDGNACPRGEKHAENEIHDPRRMVATTVRVTDGLHPLVPVVTNEPLPKPLIFDLLSMIRKIKIPAPVQINQVIIENVMNTGVNVIASRDLPRL